MMEGRNDKTAMTATAARRLFTAADMWRILMAVALTAVMANHAFAAAVAPKTDSIVSGEYVTVGDVFDGVTRDADHVLAKSPALGQEMTLSSYDLTRISNAFDLGWHPQNSLEQVVIKREARLIDRFHIEAALQQKLTEMLHGCKFEMALNDANTALYLPVGSEAALEIDQMRYDLSRGDFNAVAVAGDVRRPVSGKIYMLTQVPVPTRPLAIGEVITPDIMQNVDMRTGDISTSIIADPQALIGQSARRALPAMRPISVGDVTAPTLVKKGDLIILSLQEGPLYLTTQARALESGTEGDLIKVMNMTSRKILDASVTGAQEAAVRGAAMTM
jgi:flagella basal body P-ring formation protein FlgA